MSSYINGSGRVDAVSAFIDRLAEFSISVDRSDIIADGVLHRTHVAGDRSGSTNLAYKIHDDDRSAYFFEDHKRQVKQSGSLVDYVPATPAERAAIDRAKRERAVETAKHQAIRIEYATALYASAVPVTTHPYLTAKQLTPSPGVRVVRSLSAAEFFNAPSDDRVLRDVLLVPIQSAKLQTLQAILPDGSKFYLSGAPKRGGFHPIRGSDPSTVLLVEGYATGLALNHATGYSVACAMDAGGLLSAAEYLSTAMPDRRFIVCGDNDHRTAGNPGMTAATAVGERFGWAVRCPEFDTGADGTDWDDWLRAGGTVDRLLDRLNNEPAVDIPVAVQPISDDIPDWHDDSLPAETISGEWTVASMFSLWETLGLSLNGRGVPYINVDNVALILANHPKLRNHIWYDLFRNRIMTTWLSDEPTPWVDEHDLRLLQWLQSACGLKSVGLQTVVQAVQLVSNNNKRNELAEWFGSLKWDGKPRLDALLPTVFGTTKDDYHAAVGRCWLISMVARAFEPGCKVDTMPVFEGAQGRGKSSAMQALVGSKWFAEAAESPTNKDFYQVLNGKLLVEIAELDAFSRTEVNTIKRVMTCSVDSYRKPYARSVEDYPRMSVFAGTTNRDDWNRDETGARRFWPVSCTNIRVDMIQKHREQLFAEAVVLYQSGVNWWDVPEEQARQEQESRRSVDVWEEVIGDWLIGKTEVMVSDIMISCLKFDESRMDKSSQMRVAKVLYLAGWIKKMVRRSNVPVKVWVKES